MRKQFNLTGEPLSDNRIICFLMVNAHILFFADDNYQWNYDLLSPQYVITFYKSVSTRLKNYSIAPTKPLDGYGWDDTHQMF